MSQYSVSNLTARELHDFGLNLRRRTIFQLIVMGFSFVLSIGAFIATFYALSDPYLFEEWITGLTYVPIIAILLVLVLFVIVGLSITSLVFTILMLISISRVRDSPNHPDLQKSSLMLLIGYILSLLGMSLIGIILQLIGWNSFREYLTTLHSGSSKSSETEELQRNIRIYIIISIIITVVNQIIVIIILTQLMEFFMEFMNSIMTNPDFPYEYFLDNPVFTTYSGIFSLVSVVLGTIPLIFSLKIANGIRTVFQYAQTYPKATSSGDVQSYRPPSSSYTPQDSIEKSGPKLKYCPKCGRKNFIEAQFCSTCGEKL